MAEVKLTKNELREQQDRLGQLRRYLPTLQLKKAMLQTQVHDARIEVKELTRQFTKLRAGVEDFAGLFTQLTGVNFEKAARVLEVHKHYENRAGVEIPHFEGVLFEEVKYSLFETPPWVDGAIAGLRRVTEARVKVIVGEEKLAALAEELRQISIRVNLFEKVLIPRTINNIRKISVFLGDQQLAAVSQAKVAKGKIEERKKMIREAVA